jgi:hypothetical protein
MLSPRASLRAVLLATLLCWGGDRGLASNVIRSPAVVEGGLAGSVRITALDELGLDWSVEAAGGGWELRADRPGLELSVALRPRSGGGWTWQIARAEADLGELWPVLRGALGEAAAGWSASGRVGLAGEGEWSGAAGPTGELRLTLREGWARSDELEVGLHGLELEAVTRELAAGIAPATQRLRIRKVAAAGAELEAVELRFGVAPGSVLEVAGGGADFLGGRVSLLPFRVPLGRPELTAIAEIEAVRLAEAAKLAPWLLQAAEGLLRGRVEMSWDPAKGLRVRDGGLSITQGDGAVIRLAPSPGLLTGEMEPKFRLLPWRWARGLALHNPAYAPLKDIEMGREGLRIERFEVIFWPDGAGLGRTAAIRIQGRPTDGRLVEEVKLDLNFHGPWSEVLAFGINNQFSGLSFRMTE